MHFTGKEVSIIGLWMISLFGCSVILIVCIVYVIIVMLLVGVILYYPHIFRGYGISNKQNVTFDDSNITYDSNNLTLLSTLYFLFFI
jgi:hypothetical protein